MLHPYFSLEARLDYMEKREATQRVSTLKLILSLMSSKDKTFEVYELKS